MAVVRDVMLVVAVLYVALLALCVLVVALGVVLQPQRRTQRDIEARRRNARWN